MSEGIEAMRSSILSSRNLYQEAQLWKQAGPDWRLDCDDPLCHWLVSLQVGVAKGHQESGNT
ncbi:hypothetical protein EYF80_034493 [Liparis tanakae]|uniref:Uncharacterized protein n=1 Tax=Liparis tanakae TaxID=230148 RepID=A0A4Z2GRA5_9TELE|nr:hypothetical protein EYF80_034493 [Liparis tanakae]